MESNYPWQNRTKGQGVKSIKQLDLWMLHRAGAPSQMWDYAFELAADILAVIDGTFSLQQVNKTQWNLSKNLYLITL